MALELQARFLPSITIEFSMVSFHNIGLLNLIIFS